MTRCSWAGSDPEMAAYHDTEWGVPVHDDRLLFEFLILEGMQAGLSWSTILKRRATFRSAFDHFDAERIAGYGEAEYERLMTDPGIIRHSGKVRGAVTNARAFLKIQEELSSFDTYLWAYVGGEPIQNHLASLADIPAKTDLSIKISKDLAKRGFTFVGPTIVYAFMQAVGMVNDHTVDCFRYSELGGEA